MVFEKGWACAGTMKDYKEILSLEILVAEYSRQDMFINAEIEQCFDTAGLRFQIVNAVQKNQGTRFRASYPPPQRHAGATCTARGESSAHLGERASPAAARQAESSSAGRCGPSWRRPQYPLACCGSVAYPCPSCTRDRARTPQLRTCRRTRHTPGHTRAHRAQTAVHLLRMIAGSLADGAAPRSARSGAGGAPHSRRRAAARHTTHFQIRF